MLDFDTWVETARAVPIEREMERRGIKLKRVGHELVGPCPKCGGDDRFSVNVPKQVWNCRQCKPDSISGDIIGFTQWYDGSDFNGAVEYLTGEPNPRAGSRSQGTNGRAGNGHAEAKPKETQSESKRRPPLGPIIAIYPYVDEEGVELYQVVRHDPKEFRQRRRGADGTWIGSLKGVRRVPYRMPEATEAIANGNTILIVEGEKDSDNVWKLGVPATTNAGGAGNWQDELDPCFDDADVVIVADNDAQSVNKKTGQLLYHEDGRPKFAGRDHAHAVAARLVSRARRVRVLDLGKVWRECPVKGDMTNWIEAGGTVDALYALVDQLPDWTPAQQKEPPTPAALVMIEIARWDDERPPDRRWVVPGRIPARNVTLLSGEGGVGKTLLLQQLAVASTLPFDHAGPRDWVGALPQLGPILFVTAEDDEDELHFRYDCIARFYGVRFRDLKSRLHIMSLAGKDAVMATVDQHGIVRPTPLFAQLVYTAKLIRPIWIGLDTVADIFIVDERNRSEVRQCISLCRGLCLEVDTAVVLLSHPSLVGISSGSGLSGSTAWSNSVRSRLYLKMPKRSKDDTEEERGDETGVRVLETMKANYGPLGEPVRLAWKDGLLQREAGPTSMEKLSQDAEAQAIFLTILERYNRQDLTVSANPPARNFAPKIFAAMPEAKVLHGQESGRKKLLRDAMDYLLSKGRIQPGTGPKTLPKSKQSPCLYAGGTLL